MSKRCLIVAEISANHRQDFGTAIKLIKKAKASGAGAVKFQAYTPESLTIDADNRYFRIKHPKWGGQTLFRLYEKAYTPLSWFKDLKKAAVKEGLVFFATSFDKAGVDLLESIDVPMHKISSFEIVDLPLIEYAAKTGKPLVISTGMATLEEIKEAVACARRAGARDLTLLKCISSYPAKAEEMNLMAIPRLAEAMKCKVGLSDHTLGTTAAVVAVSLGAVMIEKHFKLSGAKSSPDSFFSADPEAFRKLADEVSTAQKALGKAVFGPTKGEKNALVFRRSLFAVKDINKGETLDRDNVRSIRPAYGLKPKYMKHIAGKKALRAIKRGSPIGWDIIGRKS